MAAMNDDIIALFAAQGGVATSGQILTHLTRRRFEAAVNTGVLERLWQGVYCLGEPTDGLRLRGLDLSCGKPVAVCLATAAALFGFDTEEPADLHVLDPPGCALRSASSVAGARAGAGGTGRVCERAPVRAAAPRAFRRRGSHPTHAPT